MSDVWKFVKKSSKDVCWPWSGSTFSGRYGRFFLNGKAHTAHRIVYKESNGEIPDSLFVMHKCNNKLCCNPDHLTVGTNRENQLHAVHSGAWPIGKYGIRGIGFDSKRGYWVARCYENGKARNLYTGPNKEKAIMARAKWEEQNCISFNLNKGATT